MSRKNRHLSFFAVFTVGTFALLFFILKPYLGVIFMAGIFAVTFYPLYEKLVDKFKGSKNLAAFSTTLIILIFVIIPVIIISALLLKEAVGLYNSIAFGGGSQSFIFRANVLMHKFASLFPSGVFSS